MSQIQGNKPRRAKRGLALPVIVAGGVSSLLLAFSLTPTFSALTASIQNSANTAGTGTLVMKEVSGSTTCLSTDGGNVSSNAATCATINKYGGSTKMVPGTAVTTLVTITNTGSVDATTFSLTPGACTAGNNGGTFGTANDICSKMNIVITSGATNVFTGTAASLASGGAVNLLTKLASPSIAAGAAVPFTFSVTLDSSAGNTYQGLNISQPLTWAFGA